MSKQSALIETQNASIDTLSVTIRSLHVNRKQMTLAVFRQLPIINIFFEDGTLINLERWGVVRYEIQGQGELWLVASRDDILYRGNIDRLFRSNFGDWSKESINKMRSRLREACKERDEYKLWEKRFLQYEEDIKQYASEMQRLGSICPIVVPDSGIDYWVRMDLETQRREWVRTRCKNPEPIRVDPFNGRIFPKLGVEMAYEFDNYIEDVEQELEFALTARDSYEELLRLPQLFIAV